jgi:hypothetical protein
VALGQRSAVGRQPAARGQSVLPIVESINASAVPQSSVAQGEYDALSEAYWIWYLASYLLAMDGIPRHWKQGLEVVELAAARQLKARQPGMRVLVSRQTEVGTVMWNSVAALRAADPKNKRGFWTSCRGKPCAVKWETDSSFFFNWNSAALRDWWVYRYIGAALNESLVDGVYLDCACRAPEGDHLNQGQFQANAQLAVNRAIALATSRGKTILTCACM